MVSVLVASGLCLPRALRLLSPLLGMASPRMGLAALVVVNATRGAVSSQLLSASVVIAAI